MIPQPLVRFDLARADALAHALDENLRTGSRQRLEARGLEALEHRARREALDLRESVDLRDGERMDVDARIFGAHAFEQTLEPFDPQIRVDAALDHDLRRALVGGELHAREHLVVRHRVAFAVLLGTEERAERAVDVADVRVVDRRIDHVRHVVRRVERHAAMVRRRAEIVQRRVLIEPDAFVERQPAAVRGAFEQRINGQREPPVRRMEPSRSRRARAILRRNDATRRGRAHRTYSSAYRNMRRN